MDWTTATILTTSRMALRLAPAPHWLETKTRLLYLVHIRLTLSKSSFPFPKPKLKQSKARSPPHRFLSHKSAVLGCWIPQAIAQVVICPLTTSLTAAAPQQPHCRRKQSIVPSAAHIPWTNTTIRYRCPARAPVCPPWNSRVACRSRRITRVTTQPIIMWQW